MIKLFLTIFAAALVIITIMSGVVTLLVTEHFILAAIAISALMAGLITGIEYSH